MNNSEIIKNAFEINKIKVTDEQIKKFDKFYDLLVEYNKKFNLTAITDINEVATKHFVDSVLSLPLLKQNSKILDVGCGAGFPSIPLAILRPDLKFTLIDSVNKKIGFIEVVKNELELNNICAIHTRAQEFCTAQTREKFDCVLSRAVAPLNVLLELTAPFVKINGCAIAYKGINYANEINDAQNAITKLNIQLINVEEKELITQPNEDRTKRYFLIFNKHKPTPKIYPREKNLVKSKPL